MKVVIDIPENDYKLACDYPEALIDCYARYIKNGTPLPEKHGRLISADKFNEFIEKHCADNLADLWKELVRRQPTVIGEDGE